MILSRIDPVREEETLIHGTVVSSTSSHIKISFTHKVPEIGEGQWRLDIGYSSIIYQRLCEAISHLHHDPRIYEAASSADPQPILIGTHLRDVLLRTFEPLEEEQSAHVALQGPDEVAYLPHETLEHSWKGVPASDQSGAFKDDMRIQSWAKRYAEHNPIVVEGDPVINGLNMTQLRAVAMMIGQRMSLIQGVCCCFIGVLPCVLITSFSTSTSATWNRKD